MKIINLLFGNKIKSIISSVVLVAVIGQLSFWVYKYQRAIKNATTLRNEKIELFNEKEEYKAYKAILEVEKDSLNKLVAENQKNYNVTVGQLQGIVQQQRLVIKNKDTHIGELRSGLICKVPQKVKVGFLKYETRLVEVNCDSLARTLE
jgi:hypothetical protein